MWRQRLATFIPPRWLWVIFCLIPFDMVFTWVPILSAPHIPYFRFDSSSFSLYSLFYHFDSLVSTLLFFLKLTKSRIFVPRKTNVEFDKFFAVLNRSQWWSDPSVQLKVEKGGCYIESIIHPIPSEAGWHPRVKPNHNLSSQIDA